MAKRKARRFFVLPPPPPGLVLPFFDPRICLAYSYYDPLTGFHFFSRR